VFASYLNLYNVFFQVAGNIVVCDRGENSRVDKSTAVAAAGGAGMILLNVKGFTSDDIVDTDRHIVPTIHLVASARDAIRAYAASKMTAATASLSPLTLISGNITAPLMARLSSRGPVADDIGLLKPDITGMFQ
jgi:hypothetical protein